jgi:hypothetical protein
LFLTIIGWFCFDQRKIYLKTEELTAPTPPPPSSSHPAFDLLQSQNYNFPPRVDNNDSKIEQELRRPQQHPPSLFWIESVCDEDYTTMFDEELKDSTAYRAINEALDDGKILNRDRW